MKRKEERRKEKRRNEESGRVLFRSLISFTHFSLFVCNEIRERKETHAYFPPIMVNVGVCCLIN